MTRYERELQEDLERWNAYLETRMAIPGEKMNQWLKNLANGEYREPPQAEYIPVQ